MGAERNATAGKMNADPLVIAVSITVPLMAPPVVVSAMAVAIAPIMNILHGGVCRGDLVEGRIIHPGLRRRRCERHCGRDRGRRQYQSSFHPLYSCLSRRLISKGLRAQEVSEKKGSAVTCRTRAAQCRYSNSIVLSIM